MSTEEATLQELWDSIAPGLPGAPTGSVYCMADGWYIAWDMPGCGLIDFEPIGDTLDQASASLYSLAFGGPGRWNVTMDDVRRGEAVLALIPSMFDMADW